MSKRDLQWGLCRCTVKEALEAWTQLLETRDVWPLHITTCVHGLQDHGQSFSLLRGMLECLVKVTGFWGTLGSSDSTEAGDLQPAAQTRGFDFMSTPLGGHKSHSFITHTRSSLSLILFA